MYLILINILFIFQPNKSLLKLNKIFTGKNILNINLEFSCFRIKTFAAIAWNRIENGNRRFLWSKLLINSANKKIY